MTDDSLASARERFAEYREQVSRMPVAVDCRGEPSAVFRSEVSRVELDAGVDLTVSTVVGARILARRTAAMVRRSDPEAYRLLIVLDGHAQMSQRDGGGPFGRSDLGLFDTSQPFRVVRPSMRAPSTFAMITFPHERLALPPPLITRLLGAPVSGRDGVGAVVAAFVRQLAREIGSCTPADTARLGLPAVDLLSALLAHELDAAAATPEAWRAALFMRIRSFVEARLGDPDLGPDMIAGAHHVSLRLVHKLFREHGVTVSGWIRHRRLERCRQDLADPALASRPVRLVAARWGFRSEAHFNRIFRRTYGAPPAEWRAHHHGARPGDPTRSARGTGGAPTDR